MARAQEVLAIDESLAGEERQRLGRDLDDALAVERGKADMVAGELAIGRIVVAQGKQLVERSIAHARLPTDQGRRIFLCARPSSAGLHCGATGMILPVGLFG
jgi:hypothetical protein